MNGRVCLSICAFLVSPNVFVRAGEHAVRAAGGPADYTSTDLCFRDDPKIDVCIRKRINDVIEQYHKGNDPFGLHAFDPLPVVNPLHFEHKTRLVGGHISIKDMITEGLTSMKLQSLRSKLQNPNKMEMGFTAHFKYLISLGQYQFNGYLGRIPINSSGRFNITYKNVETSYVLKAKLREIGNGTFAQLEILHSYPPKFGETKVFATDLVPGNAVLNRVALRFLNQYGTQISDELYPTVGSLFDNAQKDMCNELLVSYPFDALLPPTRSKIPTKI